MIDPWDPRFAPGAGGVITQTFNPGAGEAGIDVAMPVGQPLATPYPGVVIAEQDQGKTGWGKRAFVEFTSGPYAGATYAVGHETAFAVPVGTQLPAGGVFGYSGGATSDPSSGHSTGPHIEPQLIVGGQYVDPLSWLLSLFPKGGSAPVPSTLPINLPPDYRLTAASQPATAAAPSGIDPSSFFGLGGLLKAITDTSSAWGRRNIVALSVAAAVVLVLFAL